MISSKLKFTRGCLLYLFVHVAVAQELEPRRWSHLPVDARFAGIGYAFTDGNIFLDPSLLIEDAEAEIHSTAFAYIHALDVGGRSGRIDVMLPYSTGRWEGTLDGDLASTRRSGIGDPRVRFAVNLLGSPAQRMAEFAQFRANTIVGVALDVSMPLGEYRADRLINLGSNRWTFRPQIGVVHNVDKWTFELTASAWYFSDNEDYFQGTDLEQDPLYALQAHVIHTFRPGLWASFSAGYGDGAQSVVNGAPSDNRQSNVLWSASVGLPIDERRGFKLAFLKGATNEDTGLDFDRLILAYSVMWGGL